MSAKSFALPFVAGSVVGAIAVALGGGMGGASVKLSSNTVPANGAFTSTMTGFPPNTVLYGVATMSGSTWTVFEVGMTDGNGKLVGSGTAPSVAGSYPAIVFSLVGPKIAVTVLTVT